MQAGRRATRAVVLNISTKLKPVFNIYLIHHTAEYTEDRWKDIVQQKQLCECIFTPIPKFRNSLLKGDFGNPILNREGGVIVDFIIDMVWKLM